MAQASPQLFNPCSLDEDEQIPAKLWELVRRNERFCQDVNRLRTLDERERAGRESEKWHGRAWEQSCRFVEGVGKGHVFAGHALQWLVPEPRFLVQEVALAKNGRLKVVRIGEGLTPNLQGTVPWTSFRPPNSENQFTKPAPKPRPWRWFNRRRSPSPMGWRDVRGPVVNWTTSRNPRLRDHVNPIREWEQYDWPFTPGHSWEEAPAGFKRDVQFVWRLSFDSRPKNPITGERSDSPHPHEVRFFRRFAPFRFLALDAVAKRNPRELVHASITFDDLARHYRVFAIPRTILTKAAANQMGEWLATNLKKGSDLFGGCLEQGLLNEGDMFGTDNEWRDWLSHKAGQCSGVSKGSHFYRRCRYMDSLVSLIYPEFDIARLLAPPMHRARGKKYVPKGGQK